MPEFMIIGGGITGVSTAHALAAEGARVTLYESRHLAAMASGWTLAGVRQSGRHAAELPLARAAVAQWGDLDAMLDAGPTGYRRRGNVRLARNESEAAVIQALVAEQRALGLEMEWLEDNASVRAVAPALSDIVVAASYCPSDGHADPVASVQAYAAAARRLGVQLHEGTPVQRIAVRAGKVTGVHTPEGFVGADKVIVAAGLHTPELLAPLGLTLPIESRLVSVLQTAPIAPVLEPVFGVANADCAGRQQLDGRLRLTATEGTWDGSLTGLNDEDLHPRADHVRTLIERIGSLLPVLRESRVARVWGGLIDLTPDALPVIDAPQEVPGLIVAAGFSGHGFGIAPITGQLLSDLALDRPPRLPLDAFRFARLAGTLASSELTLHG